jgi:hypothetical protein
MQLGTTAPGQKGRVVLDAINQIEHLCRRAFDQDGFFDKSHGWKNRQVRKWRAVELHIILAHRPRIAP